MGGPENCLPTRSNAKTHCKGAMFQTSREETVKLKDKVALITGAGTGIGRASALLFSQEGATVAVVDITDKGAETVELIRSQGGDGSFTKMDIADPESVESGIKAIAKQYGRLDVLYNNAGGSSVRDGKTTDIEITEFWRTISVDLFGTFLCCRYAIPLMIEGGGGAIVNTTSSVALRALKGMDAYTAAKGGVISLTQALAVNYAENKIRVNAIAPSGIRTERVVARLEAIGLAYNEKKSGHLLGLGQPRDVASAAAFLASDEAAYITGITLSVDGGWYAVGPGI
jgi:NAD(P)-dependent dehydrogenase (short-subunit alcohol dehydrogenase family)